MVTNRKEYMREYRLKNKERLKQQQKEWCQKNKEKRRIYKRKTHLLYRSKHREEILARNRQPRRRYLNSKYDAKRRKIEFLLTFEEWLEAVSEPCVYCQNLLGKKTESSVGLDRIDNSQGYIIDNVVSCCGICNKIKNNFLTYEEAKVAVQAIIDYRDSQESLIKSNF